MMLVATNFSSCQTIFCAFGVNSGGDCSWRFKILRGGLGCFGLGGAGKVYFIAGHYDVKLQADNHSPLGCGPSGLNRKQQNT